RIARPLLRRGCIRHYAMVRAVRHYAGGGDGLRHTGHRLRSRRNQVQRRGRQDGIPGAAERPAASRRASRRALPATRARARDGARRTTSCSSTLHMAARRRPSCGAVRVNAAAAKRRSGRRTAGRRDRVRDMDVSLRDKSIVVTGGGSGLGAALCSVLAAEGARVSAADVRFDAARAVADAIRASGQACEAFAMDVGDETSVANALEEVAARRGGIDVVINNAGTDVTVPIEALKTSDWQRIVATNLTGPFLVSKLALRYMESRGDGHI